MTRPYTGHTQRRVRVDGRVSDVSLAYKYNPFENGHSAAITRRKMVARGRGNRQTTPASVRLHSVSPTAVESDISDLEQEISRR